MSPDSQGIEVVLIHQNPPCKKCLKTKAVIEAAIETVTVPVTFTEVFAGTPDAAQYGAVFSPMVLVGGKVVSAGIIPLKSGLVTLIEGGIG